MSISKENVPEEFENAVISIVDSSIKTWESIDAKHRKEIYGDDIHKFTGIMVFEYAREILKKRMEKEE